MSFYPAAKSQGLSNSSPVTLFESIVFFCTVQLCAALAQGDVAGMRLVQDLARVQQPEELKPSMQELQSHCSIEGSLCLCVCDSVRASFSITGISATTDKKFRMGGSQSQHQLKGGVRPLKEKASISDSEANFETPEGETPAQGQPEIGSARQGAGRLREDLQPEVEQLLAGSPLPLKSQSESHSLPESTHCDASRILKLQDQVGTGTSGSTASANTIDANRSSAVPNTLEVKEIADEVRTGRDSPPITPAGPLLLPHSTSENPGTGTHGREMTVSEEEVSAVDQKAETLDVQTQPGIAKPKKAKPPISETMGFETMEGGASAKDNAVMKRASVCNSDPSDFSETDPGFQPLPPANRQPQLSANAAEAEVDELRPQAQNKGSALKLEIDFDFSEDKENAEGRVPVPRRVGKKPGSKASGKKQRTTVLKAGASEDKDDSSPITNFDIPIPKKSYNFDSSQWDDPNFNPFGSSSGLQNSPTQPKASYTFDPDCLDSIDPFKPTKTLANTSEPPTPSEPETARTEEPTLEGAPDAEKTAKESPKKTKPRVITNACRVKKYENQSLVLDVCHQDAEPIERCDDPDLTHRERHATDEEKLASTTLVNQKPACQEAKAEVDDDTEYFEYSSRPATATKQELPVPSEGLAKSKEIDQQEPNGPSSPQIPAPGVCSTESILSFKALLSEMEGSVGNELNNIQADKTAVLSLIKEEIAAKETEANEWKQKYEDSRQEVIEMRKIVAEYEKTIAQMIEDEQKNKMASQTSIQQLITEKDQALADLNSVERSLSDLFRRYENMKSVLEGFKKNEEVLKKCAQDYLARVKQEEQRYQALKLHAEEKLDKANEEIAQVRAKANAEGAALQASLRKEQMKVDSMERTIQQKNQEIEELTKICDELIAKLGKTE
ncbi:transforming acidic coiled-coil-containing protein 1 isoform X2 [Stegostoma tigrinum]|uniref:transforming acidic coiled-coil-containing protein 1 isoform X2 n=1 Tax=Stegostoma tigrinum TaxID=3053191 RepID=UPI00202B7DEC|nr:transforming acidic coiled-coil-containing protein 1 isoform X2 [Stegostoma tigrinum]